MGPYRIHLGAGGSQIAYAGSRAFREALNRGVRQQSTFDKSKLAGGQPSAAPQKVTTLNTKRNEDDDATRKVIDAGLLDSMSVTKMKSTANVNIDVSDAGKGGGGDDSDKGLFNTARTKAAPQMPNTVTNEKGDKSAGSSEDE
jgi:hypothetical protein